MIYLDNAATTYPKPPEVARAVGGVITHIGGNPGRGGHRGALAGGRVMENCRTHLATLLGAEDAARIAFTAGCTDALNTAILGYLHQGDEVLLSPVEHNAVMRPLTQLEKAGLVQLKYMHLDGCGRIDPDEVDRAVTGRTALCVLCHASNVTGVIQPVREIAHKLLGYGVPLLLDAAQTAGTERIKNTGAAMVAMPGHKGLLGPMGVGALYVHPAISLRPLRTGGTGSMSESLDQPQMMPDRLESGTPPLPAIAGLLQGVRFAMRHEGAIAQYEQQLLRQLMDGLRHMPHVTVYGPDLNTPRTAVCAFNVGDMDSGQTADLLSQEGFATRGGLHCAPMAHRHLGTLERGAVRASLGPFNTEAEVDAFLQAVRRLAEG